MKKFKLYLLALVGCLLFTACGSDDPEEILPGGTAKEYTETYDIPADGCNATYILKKLNTRITSVSATTDWLAISTQSYSSGSPSIKIIAEANTSKNVRKYAVIIKSENGDKLTLTLVQAGTSDGGNGSGGDNGENDTTSSDIDDIHNGTSSNPAYAKKK